MNTKLVTWLKDRYEDEKITNKRQNRKANPPAEEKSASLGKIAIYIDLLQGYGADKTLLKIAEGLADLDVEVDLVTAKKIGKVAAHINPGVNLIDLGSSRFNVIKNVVGLTRYLIKQQPTVLFSSIHFNNITSVWAIVLARLLVGIKTKLVVRQANRLES